VLPMRAQLAPAQVHLLFTSAGMCEHAFGGGKRAAGAQVGGWAGKDRQRKAGEKEGTTDNRILCCADPELARILRQ
jgi:hypothetical protein